MFSVLYVIDKSNETLTVIGISTNAHDKHAFCGFNKTDRLSSQKRKYYRTKANRYCAGDFKSTLVRDKSQKVFKTSTRKIVKKP